jgi:hypothetical protein
VATGKTDDEAEQLRAEFGYNELEEKKVRRVCATLRVDYPHTLRPSGRCHHPRR